MAFATDKGIATLLTGGEKPGPWFNVRSKAQLAGPLTFIGVRSVHGRREWSSFKSQTGQNGSVIWRLMIGERWHQPVVINKVFYASNSVGELINADDETGFQIWPRTTPRVKTIWAELMTDCSVDR